MTARSVRWWSIVHRWSSLVATVFLLLLCLTGLPLIFHHEIDEALGYAPRAEMPASPQKVKIDTIAEAALRDHPGTVLQYVAWDQDQPGIVTAYVNHAVNGKPDDAILAAYSAYSARALGVIGTGPMLVVLKLHTDMFAGLPGKLFLGFMGILFLLAIVSGVVLYWPFTRRLDFGAVRYAGSRRVVWLDWHNLLSIVTVVWAVVVGATGVVNTWADVILKIWQFGQLAEMLGPYRACRCRGAAFDRGGGADRQSAGAGHDPVLRRLSGHAFHQPRALRGVHAWRHAADLPAAQAGAGRWRRPASSPIRAICPGT